MAKLCRKRPRSFAFGTILLMSITNGTTCLLNDSPFPTTQRVFAHHITYMFNNQSVAAQDMSQDQATILPVDGAFVVANNEYPSKRQRQNRIHSHQPRPRNYWLDPENLQRELIEFWWMDCGIPKELIQIPPTIPNEIILYYTHRHDLRAAIARFGGREQVSAILGDACIMPGRWQNAVAACPELSVMIAQDVQLNRERPPRVVTSSAVNDPLTDIPWAHRPTRKPRGYWSFQRMLQELYEYVDQYKVDHNRPSVWMPRLSELAANNRDDLRQAIHRYGGMTKVCRTAGMVPYREWYYFEGQLELMMELKHYLDQYHQSTYQVFPTVSEIRRRGHSQLHSLIQYFGGRKFLAARLSMSVHHHRTTRMQSNHLRHTILHNKLTDDAVILRFGDFDLDFAIRLLQYARRDQLKRHPPLSFPAVTIPSRSKLLSNNDEEGIWLNTKIVEFGGYENVARRLGLALFGREP